MKEFSVKEYIYNDIPLLIIKFCMTEENAEKMFEEFQITTFTKEVTEEMYNWAMKNKLVKSYFYSYELALIDLYNHVKLNGETNLNFEEFFYEYVEDNEIQK